jgi:hypothetical protein
MPRCIIGKRQGDGAVLAAVIVLGLFSVAGCGPPPTPPPSESSLKVLNILDSLAQESEGLPTKWSRISSPNFTIYFLKYSGIAQLILDSAEEGRAAQFKAWGRRTGSWTPRCNIYFYPTAEVMLRMTAGTTTHGSAQAPASRLIKGKLRFRRINLAADDRGILEDTLPHELSHLILSELMAPKSPPLWANEGLAQQSESHNSQVQRTRALERFLDRGKSSFPLHQIFAMKSYPDDKHLFYGQSFLLVKVLKKRGGLPGVLTFLKDTADLPALRRHFDLTGERLKTLYFRELHRLARKKLTK